MASDVTDKFENYDVFLSHRGRDTKKKFVNFLHKGLKDAGLRPFVDYESLDIGEDAWECIYHAIKKTPIALVIFSKNFAQSEWCLRELHVMLRTPSVEVLPIFYKVEPSEVRFPESGQLKEGFEKLKRRHDNAIIEQWRVDMDQASKLIGWEHSTANKRMAGDLVTEVVEKIYELANKALPLDAGEYVVGVDRVVEEIIQKLNDKKVLMLGLWGMGGIGKSTLARGLYNQMCRRFATSCFIEDVTEKVADGGVVKVQNLILEDLCKDKSKKIEDKSKGKTILEERLSKKQILVVLDDVRDNNVMNYCMTRKMLVESSLCIVTSGDKSVFGKLNYFDDYEIHTHSVQQLSREDSKQVFISYAFRGDCKVKPGFEKWVASISQACCGVPLVLKVCGALLKNEENVEIWEEVLKKLNHGTIMDEEKIFECLRISYDALQKQHQEMFLDIVCAMQGKSVNLAKCLWKSHDWSPALGIQNLIEKALITIDDQGCFSMHDHLRDMGREIERKKKSSKKTRLWSSESFKFFKENEALPKSLQTLIFFRNHCTDWDKKYIIDLDISNMKELRMLVYDSGINLISNLPKKLGWIECYSNDLEFLGNVNFFLNALQNSKVVILIMKCSNLQSLPESIGSLSNLKVLNLSLCKKLIMLPDLFGNLKNLQNLDLSCSGIQSLPESFGDLSSLEELDLSNCEKLIMLPDSFGSLKNLQNLDLSCSGIQKLPESFGGLSNLRVLNLSSCEKLIMLPDLFGSLKNLEDLYLRNSGIQSLPASFGGLSSLEMLIISYCKKLIMLPDLLESLKNLQILDLSCSGIQRLPESFGRLSNLKVLNSLVY